jgi:pimeloyl-ACP methyl ester carboxylesterase
MSLRERTLEISGLRTPALEAGPSEAPEAVVFVHGNPGSSRDWERLVAATGELGRALALDMPGFGGADKPDDFDYTVAGYARFLGEALADLGVERAHLVVHDFGGAFGLGWAAANPDAFASAVLINTGVLLGYRWHEAARVWRTPVLGEVFQATTNRPAFRLLLRRGNPRGLPREFVDRMYDDYDRGTRRAVLKLYRATEPSVGEALVETFRRLDRPALVVWGRHDPYIPPEQAERQRESFPRAEVVMLDGSGHFPFADDPDAVERAVVPFLRDQFAAKERAERRPA